MTAQVIHLRAANSKNKRGRVVKLRTELLEFLGLRYLDDLALQQAVSDSFALQDRIHRPHEPFRVGVRG